MYKWNPIYNLVIKIKQDYLETYNNFDTYDFEIWMQRLNKKEYNDIFDCLQISQDKEFLLIRYGLAEMQFGMWSDPNSIYRECRSIVIDLINDSLVLTPFRKFFNLNEVEENKLENVLEDMKNAKSIEFSNKLDGSMQSARWYDNKIFMTGSMALNIKNSWRLEDGYSKLTNNHKQMIKENPQYTFIFEYISLKDAHVVLYDKSQEGMYLTGMRNAYTGKQLSYKEVKQYANKYNVPMTEIENRNFNEILKLAKELKSSEKEGWVINIDGHLIKLKCDDYIQLHRLLDKLSSINVIIENVAEDKYDDMISKVPDGYKNRVEKIANYVFYYRDDTTKEVNKYYKLAPKNNKKEFMIWINTNVPRTIQGYVRNKYLGREVNVLKTANRYKKLKEMGIDKDYSALFMDMEENYE